MGLANDLLDFFHENNLPRYMGRRPTLGDFLDEYPIHRPATYVNAVINQLELASYLILTNTSWEFGARDRSYQTLMYNQSDGIYGSYDYAVKGFKEVRQDFSKSVRPVIASEKGVEYIGTGFICEYQGRTYFITAKHCMEKIEHITIYDDNDNPVIPDKIFTPKIPDYKDEHNEMTNVDLAILVFNPTTFTGSKQFRFSNGEVLDSVLVMGYPPMGIFDKAQAVNNAVQLAETASIASFLKSTTGQAVGRGHSPTLNHDYLLINARVKGGSSGSPVINNKGKVIGMITEVPTSGVSSKNLENDMMGFGFVLPQELIVKMLEQINGINTGVDMRELPIKKVNSGFSTIK